MYYSFRGFILGFSVLVFGYILDNTISYKSKLYLINNNKKLLIKAYCYTIFNLLILSPIYYDLLNKYLISCDEKYFNIIKYLQLLIIQSLTYYIVHYMMHNIYFLRKIHKFHHKFTNILIPSIGISVSPQEFTIAYIFPFMIGSYLTNSNIITINSAIGTISLLNMFIHCNEFSNIKLYKYLVSPNDHSEHHTNTKKNSYAAPLINIDNLIEDLSK